MRRRKTDCRDSESGPPVGSERSSLRGTCEREITLSAVSDAIGNVLLPGMADQGIGGPVSRNEGLKPKVTDLGSDSEESSEEEERSDSSSESDDSDNDDPKVDRTTVSCCGGPGTDPDLAVDGKAVLPAGSAVSMPMQQPANTTTYGNITVKESSGIHFGNKTFYHGPVTIQQYVYGNSVVKNVDESLQVKVGGGQLAITDGSETGNAVNVSATIHRRSGLDLNSGSFRIGAGGVAASKGNGLLWRHLLGRRPGAATWAIWIALSLGCMALLAGIVTLAFLGTRGKKEPETTPGADADAESEEFNNGYRSPAKQQNHTILSRRRLVVVPRREWVAQPPKSKISLKHPVEYVVISQTATDPCTTQAECTLTVRYIQVFHVEGKKWMDIAFNFLVAGDGQAYEGRGWDVVGAHTAAGFNAISVGISFVGTFVDVLPPPVQIRACKLLIEEGIRLGKISPNYKLIGDRQVSPTDSPGQKLYEELQTWERWTADV